MIGEEMVLCAEIATLRAHVAELKADVQVLQHEATLRARVAELEAALKPLAALSLRSDVVKDDGPDRWYGFIGVTHVRTARAALAMQTAPPTPDSR